MEHRLCYRHTPERPGSPEENARQQVLRENQTKLLQHLHITEDAQIRKPIEDVLRNPERLEQSLRLYETTQENRLQETSTLFKHELQKERGIIAGWQTKKMKKDVLDIIDALQEPLPKVNGKLHRYGTTARVDFDTVKQDTTLLEGFLNADNPPDVQQALLRVHRALTYLNNQDIGYNGWQYADAKKNNKFDAMVNRTGKVTLIVALMGAGILTGTVALSKMISKREFSLKSLIAPLLCFGIAAPMMNPRLMEYFSSIETLTKQDLNITIRNKEFRTLCRDYHVRGKNWSKAFAMMFNNPTEIQALAAQYRPNTKVPDQKVLSKDIDRFVRRLPLAPEEELELRRMIHDGRLADLSYMLKRVETDDGKRIILDYITMGASQYENIAYKNADTLKKAGEAF